MTDTVNSDINFEQQQQISAKMAESVEELASIIKDYAKRHRKLNDRISDLETKYGSQGKVSKEPVKKSSKDLKSSQTSFGNPVQRQSQKSPSVLGNMRVSHSIATMVHSPPVKDEVNGERVRQGAATQQNQVTRGSNSKKSVIGGQRSSSNRKESDKENTNSMNVTTTTHNGSGGKGGADPPNFRTSFEEKLFGQQKSTSGNDEPSKNQLINDIFKVQNQTSYSKERMVQRNIKAGGVLDERTLSLNNSFNFNGSLGESFAKPLQ